MTRPASGECANWRSHWVQRFLDDVAVVRSANTLRAYAFDLHEWARFCQKQDIDPSRARPRTDIEFIRLERERSYRADKTVSARTLVRRLSAIRQWYAYLALEPEETGVHRNPIPSGTAIRTGAGIIAERPALLRYDRSLPQVLSADEMDDFAENLTATQYRDRAIFWLLKDGGMRISELLNLRLAEINWGKRVLTIRPGKGRRERLVPVTQEAITVLSNYIRLERPRRPRRSSLARWPRSTSATHRSPSSGCYTERGFDLEQFHTRDGE